MSCSAGGRPDDGERARFVAMAAHELRSPVTTISGFVQLLLADDGTMGSDRRATALAAIGRQCDRLGAFVNHFIVAANIDAGSVTVERGVVRLRPAIAAALKAAGDVGVSIECDDDVAADADMVHTIDVLSILVANARDHGRPPIVVRAREQDATVEVRVVDGGPGVAADDVSKLFERFASLTGRKPESTGMALFVARGLARVQGGDVWYEPADSGGACFVFSVPSATTVR